MTAQEIPVLEVKDLSVRFGKAATSAVKGVSFRVNSGETLALVGESGSGKSVTSMATMRLIDFDGGRIERGEIRLRCRDGQIVDVPNASQARMREIRGKEIAMIFQEPMTSLNPVMKIGDQLTEAILLHQNIDRSSARNEALKVLDMVRIANAKQALDRYPHEFSGGMRQRAMISIALCCRPSLLVADEPTTALDVTVQAQILELMRDLQHELDMALLFITHDLGVVAEIADRVVVMNKGEVVEQADAHSLFQHPSNDYTQRLLNAVPRLGATEGTDRPMRFDLLDAKTDEKDKAAQLFAPIKFNHPADPLLSVRNLAVRFPQAGGVLGRTQTEVHAVEKVSFDLFAGETLALVGESGSGKTTTGRALLSLAPLSGGLIRFDGHDVSAGDKRGIENLKRHIQFIFQDPYASLNPRMKIGQSIMEPMKIHRIAAGSEARARAEALLERVGLKAQMFDRLPHQFSGGQRQRICIARALAAEPKVIIADESVSALDVSVQAQVINLLLDLQAETDMAMLFISHDMAVVERVSHRVAVMYLGQIVELGSRRQVFESAQHPYTQRLLSGVPIADPSRRKRHSIDTSVLVGATYPVGATRDVPELVDVGGRHFVAKHRVGSFAAV